MYSKVGYAYWVGKIQRWGSTIYSQNLEVSENEKVDWESVSEHIANTISL